MQGLPGDPCEVGARLRRALRECLDLDVTALADEMPMQVLMADAVGLAQIETVIEAEFDVRIPDFALANLDRFGDLVRTVRVCLWARGDELQPVYDRAA
jgi:acyl carrier protein